MARFVDTPQNACRAGVARCDITPPVGIYHRMWGAATHDRSTGVHRPLLGTVLVLAPDADDAGADTMIALLALDHCLLWADEMAALRKQIAHRAGWSDEQRIFVSFSHTHAAGLMGHERAEMPGGDLIQPYLEQMGDQLGEALKAATANMQSATIVYGQGTSDLAAHRDFYDENLGEFVCGFNPAGTADQTLVVARVADLQGNNLATLVNYACHPTTLAWQNTLISPDYPGAMRELIEAATAAPCLFLQGASGDLGPRHGFTGDLSVVDRNGRQLAHAVLAILESLPAAGTRFQYAGRVVSGASIGVWEHVPITESAQAAGRRFKTRHLTVPLPYRDGLPSLADYQAQLPEWQAKEQAALAAGDEIAARDCRAQAERVTRQIVRLKQLPPDRDFPFPVDIWLLGDVIWVAVESEHYSLLQTALRHQFPQHRLVVMTLINGSRPTYLPTRETYGTGTYPETVALLAAGCLETLIAEISGAIRLVLADNQ